MGDVLAYLHLDIPSLERLFLLVELLSFRKRDFHLHEISLEIDFSRNERESFFPYLLGDVENVLLMEQYFPFPFRIQGIAVRETGVGAYVHFLEKESSGADRYEAPFQVDISCTEALHFMSEQLDTAFVFLEDLIIR